MFCTIGGKVVNGLFLLLCILQISNNIFWRTNLCDSGGFAFLQCRLDAHPNDVVDGKLVAEDDLLVIIDVDDGRKTSIGSPKK